LLKKKIQVAIDSPAGSGAGTQAKLISKYYNLFYLDTGKLYRILGYVYLKNKKKINYVSFKKIILKTKFGDLKKKYLLQNEIGLAASHLAKNKSIRSFVTLYQKKVTENPPKKFNGVCFDGRDITYNIMPNADIKIFMTAKINVRAKRRYTELISQGHNISFKEVYKTIKKRDNSDFKRKISPLIKTKDAILIDNTNLTINQCFKKIKKIINKKLK
tara:strand:- start:86 stop:733 length:648 start_codon:yes stop_codon:yes gene_type:complete